MTDLAEFITAHATPYDPDTDTYRRPPFAAPIKAGKNTPIYNAHSYHTKVPPQGIVPYIEHYTDPSDLVLDPFCGSGMTGVACLASARHALLNDLSPAATHIAYNFCTPVDTRALRREFARIHGLSLPAAKSRLLRARQRLRERIASACQVRFEADGQVAGYVPRT